MSTIEAINGPSTVVNWEGSESSETKGQHIADTEMTCTPSFEEIKPFLSQLPLRRPDARADRKS